MLTAHQITCTHNGKALNEISVLKPLDEIQVSGRVSGRIHIRDAKGQLYVDRTAQEDFSFQISGALGGQLLLYINEQGAVEECIPFQVDCATEILDEQHEFGRLLELLRDTMFIDWHKGYEKGLRINGKWYQYYVSWIRDHVHCLKGYKYFDFDAAGMKSGIELYADSQRDDGMIYDKCKKMLHSDLQNWRDVEFVEGDFIKKIPDNPMRRWQRVPVENDVEYLWIEGLYYTWKATGDTTWMEQYLDHALKAVAYSTSDTYRWSEQYKLLKRGYTIDTWDFQHAEDIARSGSSMRVDPDKTIFGVMFGDNTGMAASCRYLAEMLRHVDRIADADAMQDLADELSERLNDLAWNGNFFTHHVSEDPSVQRDCGGTDETQQIVQSNAYSLNRGISQEQCAAIIKSYQRIREEMPETSAGEFYSCFPPFEKGFHHNDWNYMNGGVTTICAGELAHGAFEHGFEQYAVDILRRLLGWTEKLGGYLHCCLKGKLPEPLDTVFTPVDLTTIANADLSGEGDAAMPRWTGEGANDMRGLPQGAQVFEGVEFSIIERKQQENCCLALAQKDAYAQSLQVPIQARAKSIYFLQSLSGGASFVGSIVCHYTDGSSVTQYIHNNNEIKSFFMPAPNASFIGGNGAGKQSKHLRVAWQGANGQFENVGMFVYGWNNPNPEKEIAHLDITCAEHNAYWFIAGISLSDQAVCFPENQVSYGIPDMWGSAALVYALIEGLAGIVDDGIAFDTLRLSPRWDAANIKQVTASVVYPSSKGYCLYHYQRTAHELRLQVASCAQSTQLSLLLPEACTVAAVLLNGEEQAVQIETVESASYLQLSLSELGAQEICIRY